MSRLLPILLLAALGCAAKLRRQPAAWDRADAQRAPAKGCANLTLVLDNWKFAITSQMRNLLLFDHQTVLPDYGRIRSLSGALDELYRDFSALKEQLGRLSARFAEVEAFVDQLSRARGPGTPPHRRGLPQPARSPLELPPSPHSSLRTRDGGFYPRPPTVSRYRPRRSHPASFRPSQLYGLSQTPRPLRRPPPRSRKVEPPAPPARYPQPHREATGG
ncbi:uncharacterized protein LOC128976727 [Indicator indicator]|uniref:uncharacterized protein LOC128976727 n=1 Tax=Indicator indicator TaxID=1002788 RepID=UPI0023E03D6D|nr:uncharacterized protein LOC128976727 [Indicator indicator]